MRYVCGICLFATTALCTSHASANLLQSFFGTQQKNPMWLQQNLANQTTRCSVDIMPYGQTQDANTAPPKPRTDPSLYFFDNPFLYGGHYFDAESGLDYMSARYYSPKLRHFMAQDNRSITNRYQYASGNPIMRTDPSGHSDGPISPFIIFAGNLLGVVMSFYSGNVMMFAGSAFGISDQLYHTFTPKKFQNTHTGQIVEGAMIAIGLAVSVYENYATVKSIFSAPHLDLDALTNEQRIQNAQASRISLLDSQAQRSNLLNTRISTASAEQPNAFMAALSEQQVRTQHAILHVDLLPTRSHLMQLVFAKRVNNFVNDTYHLITQIHEHHAHITPV